MRTAARSGHTMAGGVVGLAADVLAAQAPSGWDDQAIAVIYRLYFGSLVRQAARLVQDVATAEDVVQDCFITMHSTRPRLADRGKTIAYLRRSVVNRAHSVLRHQAVASRHAAGVMPAMPSAEDSAFTRLDARSVREAVTCLAPRQRQVVALRYFGGMTEAQTAAFLKISKGAVKAHTSRAMAALRAVLGSPPGEHGGSPVLTR
jgi:RNA polymerase sigma-70 factor (sigma-E family)